MRDEIIQTLLEKVKKDYSVISERFDETRRNPWEEFEWFAAYLEQNQKLLDVGCGNGRLAAFLKNKKIEYTGIDNNKELIAIARGRHPYAKFAIADQTAVHFPNESFDHVWNIAAFHHVPSKKLRLQALKEMKRVLKKDGLLILTVWNLWQKKYRKYTVKSILHNLLFGEYEYNDTFIPWGKVSPSAAALIDKNAKLGRCRFATDLIDRGTKLGFHPVSCVRPVSRKEKLVMRYYHAFRPMELRDLLKKAGFALIDEFYTKRGKRVKFSESYNLCFVARHI